MTIAFALIYGILVAPLPWSDPSRLHEVRLSYESENGVYEASRVPVEMRGLSRNASDTVMTQTLAAAATSRSPTRTLAWGNVRDITSPASREISPSARQ